MDVHMNDFNNTLNIPHLAVIFVVFGNIYVMNSWNICARNFKL